ncbi:unnamed protein product [Acanthoscelides obtectus]|uniref:DDE-1 domain-containing protein n=1 Tax=Acanthoscelides obtectus TaxID=200917 RepID=A0A9P0PKS7_ACAOB|nr:unnamed protein product [Acanthoscelides obtectus]CAK1672446.1 hypothetical protein AOBTE_LOCUS28898 [Acanthoscelides obtectus]
MNITLFCLPSNTSHELQPMDKSVFRSFETFWDQEALHFLTTNPGKTLTKIRFGEIFTTVWLKAMTPSNIISGFKATGIYPFRPDALPESTYAPSAISHREEDKENRELSFQNTVARTESSESSASMNNVSKASTSGNKGLLQNKKAKKIYREAYSSDSESLSDFSLHDDTSANTFSEDEPLATWKHQNINVNRLNECHKQSSFSVKNNPSNTSFDSDDEVPLILLKNRENIVSKTATSSPPDNSFTATGLLITSEIKVPTTKRKPALNSKAQELA